MGPPIKCTQHLFQIRNHSDEDEDEDEGGGGRGKRSDAQDPKFEGSRHRDDKKGSIFGGT